MIILDTNVVSEPMKRTGDPRVVDWLNLQAPETLHLTAISLAKLLFGVESLPDGRRKSGLRSDLPGLIDRLFADRILSFDKNAAVVFARAISEARRRGLAVDIADGQIAAVARSHGFQVATRDTAPFEAMGVEVVNPWVER